MSGTISDAAGELREVYGVRVLVIPPNCPVQRKDQKDLFFRDADSQFRAAITTAAVKHETGQPVLIVVSTIAETELVSKLLTDRRIPHNVLNANNAFWEATIIKEAGQKNAVTVATAMAGRGTDIRLGEGVPKLGGLAVIGIGRMHNTRQERQARGRAGRQGDPGSSCFFVSLEDEVVAAFGPSDMEKYLERHRRIGRRRVRRIANHAQSLGEEKAVLSRKQALYYDEVMQKQRQLIYAMRDELLDGGGISIERFEKIAAGNIRGFVKENQKRGKMDRQIMNRYLLDNVSYRMEEIPEDALHGRSAGKYLLEGVRKSLAGQEKKMGDPETMLDFMRVATLTAIDDAWVEEVDYLQQLQAAVSGRASAQRNPVYEYRRDALESFRRMEQTVQKNIMRNILLSDVEHTGEGELRILFP